MALEKVRIRCWVIEIGGLKTTAELRIRMGALERLKDQMRAMGMSIAKAVSNRTSRTSMIYTHPVPSGPSGNVYS